MTKYIRHFLLFAGIIATLTGCISNDLSPEQGKIKLSISKNSSVIIKSTVTEAPDSFLVSTTDLSDKVYEELSGTYESLKGQEFIVPVGTYNMNVCNITEEKAEEGRGAQRFYGSQSIKVTPMSMNAIDITCTMANARVSFTFDDSFKNTFDITNAENPAKVVASTSKNTARQIEFSNAATLAEDDAQIAYFNTDAQGTFLNFTITARRKSDSSDKTFTHSIEIKPQSWYKITVKSADGTNEISVKTDY